MSSANLPVRLLGGRVFGLRPSRDFSQMFDPVLTPTQIDPACRLPVTQRNDLEAVAGRGIAPPRVGQLSDGA